MKKPTVTLKNDDVADFGISFSCSGYACQSCSLYTDRGCGMDVLEDLRDGNNPPPENVADVFLRIADILMYGKERE